MGEIVIRSVLPDQIDVVWERAKGYIEQALEEGDSLASVDDIKEKICKTFMQMYLIMKDEELLGVFTTEVDRGSRKSVIRVVTLSGEEYDSWKELVFDMLKAWGKELGIQHIQLIGRLGWMRRKDYRDAGWKPTQVIMEYTGE